MARIVVVMVVEKAYVCIDNKVRAVAYILLLLFYNCLILLITSFLLLLFIFTDN